MPRVVGVASQQEMLLIEGRWNVRRELVPHRIMPLTLPARAHLPDGSAQFSSLSFALRATLIPSSVCSLKTGEARVLQPEKAGFLKIPNFFLQMC